MNNFRDSQFMTAREKELVFAQWKRFIERGFSFEHFTDRLYKFLTLHASFIAHFNRNGFYSTYFENPEATVRFLNQFDIDFGCRSAEYGSTWWLEGNYADINKAMCEVVERVKGRLYAELALKIRGRDLAIASQLLARHGIRYEPSQALVKQTSSVSQRTAERQ